MGHWLLAQISPESGQIDLAVSGMPRRVVSPRWVFALRRPTFRDRRISALTSWPPEGSARRARPTSAPRCKRRRSSRLNRSLQGHPFLTEPAAVWLREHGAALVGIDSLNIDSTATGARPVHTVLLGADIPICEHLCHLGQLPDFGFRFHTAPVKVKGFGSFPVRAYAIM